MATKLLYNMMATFTLFLLQLDDSAQLLIGSYYDSSVTTKKKIHEQIAEISNKPRSSKADNRDVKRKEKTTPETPRPPTTAGSSSSINSTLQETLQRPQLRETKSMQEFSFWESCPIPVCPLNHVFYLLRLSSANTIYPDCSGSTRGRTDGRTAARPTTTSSFLL
jgi:hypothetical protein